MKILFARAIQAWLARQSRRKSASVVALIAVGQMLGWLLASWIGPAPPQLSTAVQGDATLRSTVLNTLDQHTRGLDAMAVAMIDGETIRFATFGQQRDGAPVDASSRFEIGSLTKPLTGLLLADMIEAGRVEADATLAETTHGVLSLEGEGARTTLARLARHRTGWPSVPDSMLPRVVLLGLGGRNPYTGDAQSVLDMAASQSTSKGDQAYSNLGFAALGNALAVHERTDYASLLEHRILAPLGMRNTDVLPGDGPLPLQRVQGRRSSGRATQAWLASGWQAAGVGVWSTAADLSRLVTAIINGTAPGQRATEPPPVDGGRHRLGYGWMIRDVDERKVLWHNGGTGGFSTWFGVSRAERRGVAILSNTTRPVDALGLRLLTGGVGSDKQPRPLHSAPRPWIDVVLVLVILIGTAPPLVRSIRHLVRRQVDRHTLVRDVASAVAVLALTRALVAWERVPVVLWNLGAGFALTCLLGAMLAWSTTTITRGSRPVRRRLMTFLLLAWNASLIALVF